MEAISQIVDLDKLGTVINIPKEFNYTKVEVIIFPADDTIQNEKEKFIPESFGLKRVGFMRLRQY
jgi:hypothetical protein